MQLTTTLGMSLLTSREPSQARLLLPSEVHAGIGECQTISTFFRLVRYCRLVGHFRLVEQFRVVEHFDWSNNRDHGGYFRPFRHFRPYGYYGCLHNLFLHKRTLILFCQQELQRIFYQGQIIFHFILRDGQIQISGSNGISDIRLQREIGYTARTGWIPDIRLNI